MIKGEFIGMQPKIEVEVNRFCNGSVNYVEVKIGELVLELSEKDADYLRHQIDHQLWDETKEDLEEQVEQMETRINMLEEQLDEAAPSYDGVGYYGMI